jgi:hypothetical protein
MVGRVVPDMENSTDLLRTDEAHEGSSASRSEENSVVPLRFSTFHSRRSDRHTGNGQPDSVRPLIQQFPYGQSRDVTLDDVSGNFGSVTRSEIGRYAKAFPDDLQVCGFLNRYREPGIPEMLHPTRTATAVWILVHKDRWSLSERRN